MNEAEKNVASRQTGREGLKTGKFEVMYFMDEP